MSRIEHIWQRRGLLARCLWPIAQIYGALNSLRRFLYARGVQRTKLVPLPVVVVGNLSVGGTGKTPLCARLVEIFEDAGWRPAIVSRGYGGKKAHEPHLVVDTDTADRVGDEPLMLFRQTQVPVCVCVDRSAAVQYLAEHSDANIVISDDGLQHLAMPRVAQIIVMDAYRGFGNEWMLPAGPLRDRLSRLADADLLALQIRYAGDEFRHKSIQGRLSLIPQAVQQGNTFYLQAVAAAQLVSSKRLSLDYFKQQQVHAVAGIGNPARFFESLKFAGIDVIEHPMPDHHTFTADDLNFQDQLSVLVTSKDAVKIKSMSGLSGDRAERVHEIITRVELGHTLEKQLHALERSLRHFKR